MRKRNKRSWLSFVLIIGMLFTTLSFPEYASAAGVDKTEAVKDTLSVKLIQDGVSTAYANSGTIDMTRDIGIEISFKPVFNTAVEADKRIEKGDYVEFDLGDKIKFTGEHESQTEWNSPVIDSKTQLKICDVIYKKDDSTGNIKIKFDFSNADDAVFNRESANIGTSLKIKVDSKYFDWETTTEKVIKIFGKEYTIGLIDVKGAATKKGVVDAKNHKIDWTIEIERYINGTSPKNYLSLEGFTVWERPEVLSDGSGDYIDGTFKINGNIVDATGTDFSIETIDGEKTCLYTIKNEDLDPANKGKVVVNLSTRIDFSGNFNSYDKKIYKNSARFYKKSANGRYDGIDGGFYSAVGDVYLSPIAKKYGNIDYTGKKITWSIELNPDNYDLGDVTVSDDLTKDVMGRVPQTFKTAYFWKINKDTKESSGIISVEPVVSGENHKFIIPDVKEKIYLIIETEIEPGNYSVEFDNYAYIWWNGDESKKVKVYAHVSNINSGATNRGSIDKTAEHQTVTYNGLTYGPGDYVGTEPEWTIRANQAAVTAPGDYYIYDTFIFDNDIKVSADTINAANGFSIRKVGDNSVTALANGADFDKMFPKQDGTHQRLANVSNPITSSTAGLTHAVYEVIKDGKVVGHILELKLVSGMDNFAKLKSKITDRRALMTGYAGSEFYENVKNYIVFTKGSQPILTKTGKYKYLTRMISKASLSVDAARKFLSDYNAEAVNGDVFNDETKKTIHNDDGYAEIAKKYISYDRKSKSIIYRLSINASDIKDVDGDIGKFIVSDKLNWAIFNFEPLIEDAENPANNKYFLIYKGTPALKYEDTDIADVREYDERTVKAVGNYLSDSELIANNISGEVANTSAVFTFDKLNGPYVIFLKAKLNDYTKVDEFNERRWIDNNASIRTEDNKYRQNDSIETVFDERFLWKVHEGTKIDIDDNGFINWNLFYRPYKTYNDNNATKLRIEDKVSSNILLRKEKGTNKLIFEGDNYKIWKGEFDYKGNFINPVEVTENLDKIFTYDTTTRKLSIHIPDNDSSYKISYITDFADKVKRGDDLENEAALIESNTQKGRTVKVSHRVEADTFGNLRDKTYHRLEILKKNASGDNLKDAEFNLKRLAAGGMIAEDFGTHKTGLDGTIKFTNLTRGEYELTEVTAPEGYKKNEAPYRLKVMELEDGFKVDLIGDYAGKATIDQNSLTVINDPKDNPPNNPPNKPGNPSDPKPDPNPEKPPTPPTPPEPTNPTTPPNDTPSRPGTPTYPRGETPDPNDPGSPDRITVIDEHGTPLGNMVKHKKPDGSVEYIPENEVPLTGIKTEEPKYKPILPQTGGDIGWLYMLGAGFILVAAGLTLAKRKEEEEK